MTERKARKDSRTGLVTVAWIENGVVVEEKKFQLVKGHLAINGTNGVKEAFRARTVELEDYGLLQVCPRSGLTRSSFKSGQTLRLMGESDSEYRDVRHTLPRGGFVTIVQPKDEFGGVEDRRFQVPLRYGRIDYDKVYSMLNVGQPTLDEVVLVSGKDSLSMQTFSPGDVVVAGHVPGAPSKMSLVWNKVCHYMATNMTVYCQAKARPPPEPRQPSGPELLATLTYGKQQVQADDKTNGEHITNRLQAPLKALEADDQINGEHLTNKMQAPPKAVELDDKTDGEHKTNSLEAPTKAVESYDPEIEEDSTGGVEE